MPTVGTIDVQRTLAAGDGDLEGALEALVARWADRRLPELAEQIERLGWLIDSDRPAIPVEQVELSDPQQLVDADAFDARWRAEAEGARPAAIGRLLEVCRFGPQPSVVARLNAMLRWRPDPRVAAEMVRLSDRLSGYGNANAQLWMACCRALGRHADPRRIEWVRTVRARLVHSAEILERPGVHACIGELSAAYELDAAGAPPSATAADIAELRETSELLDRLVDLRRREAAGELQRENALMDAVLADPAAAGPRLAYAERLRSRGDPRGDFIALAASSDPGADRQPQGAAQTAVLGPLRPLIEEARFDRGLLASVGLQLRRELERPALERERLLTDIRWRTVREIELQSAREDASPLLRAAPLDALASLVGLPVASLGAIADRAVPLLRLAELQLDWDGDDAWERLDAAAARLPALRRLSLLDHSTSFRRPTPQAAFFGSALLRGLDALRSGKSPRTVVVVHGWPRFGAWLDGLFAAGSPVPLVEIATCGFKVVMRRGEGGRYALELSGELLVHPLDHHSQTHANLLESVRALAAAQVERVTLGEVLPDRRSLLHAEGAHLPWA